ncbi:MAG: diaminopimelate decarboxylase [bacterium]|nr:diaminopimelate decarboxylase [bacterium]
MNLSTSKVPYEKPLMVKHVTGMMNKFGSNPAFVPLEEIDGVRVSSLVEQYGSPLFVFSEKTISAKVRELRDALALRYPKSRVAWSYKTNYLDAICRIHHNEGSWAEVVSEFEYDKAVRNGVPENRIIFNGPYKTGEALSKAFNGGAIVNLDNFDELAEAERSAANFPEPPSVGIRLNMSTSSTPHWSRFGFNLENGQALDVVKRILAGGKLQIKGLHCHLGTFIHATEAYGEVAAKMARFANLLRNDHGITVDYLDLGGGFASENTLHSQYLPGQQATPPLSRFVEEITDGLRELDFPSDSMPTLFLETGRALVDASGYLITTVVANKRLPDGQRSIIIDAGVSSLFTSFWYKHDVVPAQPTNGLPETAVIHGPLCMNIDVMRPALVFPPVDPGHKLIFKNVGAYNVTQWMQFITYRPAVVLVSPDSEHSIIRKRENLETVVEREEMAPWLSK